MSGHRAWVRWSPLGAPLGKIMSVRTELCHCQTPQAFLLGHQPLLQTPETAEGAWSETETRVLAYLGAALGECHGPSGGPGHLSLAVGSKGRTVF